jgi:hypothetical protein
MRPLLSLAVAFAFAACAPAPSAMPTPSRGISSLEYDLYAMVIKKERTAIFTPDSTSPVVCRPNVSWDPCQLHGSSPVPEAWTAFIAVNQSAVAIDSVELARRGIQMVGPFSEAVMRVCPLGPAWFELSRVGFNHDSTEAVLQSGSAAGKGSFDECGYSAGETSLYRRKPGGKWEWVGIFSRTMS